MSSLSTEERNWAALAHASGGLTMFLAPSLGFLGPLVVWALQKDKSEAVGWHAKQALTFQLAMTVATWLCGALGTMLSCFLIGFVFYAAAVIPWLLGVVMPLIGAAQVNNGQDDWTYPVTGPMVDRPRQLR